jgi:hypothetical protein
MLAGETQDRTRILENLLNRNVDGFQGERKIPEEISDLEVTNRRAWQCAAPLGKALKHFFFRSMGVQAVAEVSRLRGLPESARIPANSATRMPRNGALWGARTILAVRG